MNFSRVRLIALAIVVVAIVMASPVAGQEELMTYAAPDCSYGGEILSIEALDELTVQFTLCVPDPAFPSKVAFSAFAIHPSEHLEATGGGGPELFQYPIGTGPYMLENWDLGNELVLTRNESYWGDPAVEPTVIFRWNSEAAARLVELQAGAVDGIDNPGPGDFEIIENDPNLALYERDGLNIFYVGFNNTIAPFDNLNVRLAISQAIDKERIVANFYPPGSSAAMQFLPPFLVPGYTPGFEPLPYDLDAARQLLADSGLELPLEVTLYYRDVVRTYLPNPGVVAQDIQAQLTEIGINVTLEVVESGTFIDGADAGLYGMHLLGWNGDYPDATNFFDYHFGAGATAQFGEKWPEITDTLAQAAQLADPAARDVLYAQVNAYLRDFAVMVPVAHGGSGVAYRASILNAHASPLGNEYFAVMEDPDDDNFVWMQNAEPIGLYCADESDGESLRACEQINESLLSFAIGGTAVEPALAESYEANEDLTVWTFHLREGVTFHDGSAFDANDVVLSYAVQWDATHPLHIGRDGSFSYWSGLFGVFLNAPATE